MSAYYQIKTEGNGYVLSIIKPSPIFGQLVVLQQTHINRGQFVRAIQSAQRQIKNGDWE